MSCERRRSRRLQYQAGGGEADCCYLGNVRLSRNISKRSFIVAVRLLFRLDGRRIFNRIFFRRGPGHSSSSAVFVRRRDRVVNLNLLPSHRSVVYFIWVSRRVSRVVLAVKPRRAPRVHKHTAFAAETFLFPYELSLIFTSAPETRRLSRRFIIFRKMITTRSPGSGRRRVYAIRIVFFPNENSPTAQNHPAPFPVDRTDTWPAFDRPVPWPMRGGGSKRGGALSEATISEI